jgi:uncharacterized Zn finger protein
MTDTIPIKCPSCGGTKFSAASRLKSLDEFSGSVCADCGHTVSAGDVKKQAIEIARKAAKEAIKRSRF